MEVNIRKCQIQATGLGTNGIGLYEKPFLKYVLVCSGFSDSGTTEIR